MLRILGLLALCMSAAHAESGKLILHLLQLPVGEETYELSGNVLRSHFEYTERGSTVALDATLKMKADLTPEQFEAHGRSYRPFSVDASVTPGPQAGPFFTISGYTPLSVQMMMLRYWLSHGKPRRLKQLPAGADLIIEETGRETIPGGARFVRYSIGNVVWGRESLWLNERQELAAAATYAGNLPLEAVREEYRAALPQLIRSAVADRIRELSAIHADSHADLAIVNALLIDGNGGTPVEGASVLVKNGRIAAAGPRDRVAIPRGVPTIDAAGKSLLPGLWEMHAHFAQVEYGPAYLAAGVTTARDCGGEFEFLTSVRDLIDNRNGAGPRLILAGLVDGSGTGTFGVNWADTPDEGRAMVAKYKAAGFAQMKVYNRIKPEVLAAIAAEAHRQGMSVTGHVPNGMTAFQGVEAGMDQINHLGPVQQAVRAVGLEKAVQFFKDHHTVIDPTLAWGELLSRPHDVEIASFEPGFAKAPFTLTSVIGTASGQGARLTESFRIVRALVEAGVPVVAGTDKAVPAHSLHRELELYVQAGVPAMEVIRLATIGSARAMGMERETGSIEAGKRADMILVDGNPLQNFANLRKVVRVIASGRSYDPAKLWESAGFKP
ncbi:MAG TPA: amidohydrolase family protein [Candidatus Solibacter sp.]